MSRETERFNRALSQFLKDNPDLDPTIAHDEFIKMFNSGEYKLNDEFTKAEELYEKALDLDDIELVKDALRQALAICPTHFEAKGELLLLESKTVDEKISRMSSLLNEEKDYLIKNEEIDFDNFERTLWLRIECRPYLRNLFKLMNVYNNEGRYEEALEIGKELIRLDPENHQDQTVFYLVCLLGLKKYEAAVNDAMEFYKLGSHSKFLFIAFLASMYMNNDKDAFKYLKNVAKYNMSFVCFILGVAKLEPEDYQQIFSNPYVAEESFEDAARIFYALSKIIVDNIEDLNIFIDKYTENIINLIDPTPKGMELLFMLTSKREATLKEVIQALSQIRDDMDFGKLKNESEANIRKELIKLKDKKYLEYHESKYYLTYLGHSVLGFFVGDDENEDN